MKKIFSLFFLLLIFFLTLNKEDETYTVFKENNFINFNVYRIGTINNSVNIDNLYEIFKDVSIHGVYINDKFYIFTNYDLNQNINELKNKFNLNTTISSIEIYADKTELSKLLKNNFLFLE